MIRKLTSVAILVLTSVALMTAKPHSYTKAELSDPELLESAMVVEIPGADERGLFIGIYKKNRFKDLEGFASFITNISSLTQLWYATGDLDEALEWYIPDDTQKEWVSDVEKGGGGVRAWIAARLPNLDPRALPVALEGRFWIHASDGDFQIVGESKDVFFEVFIADLIL